MRLLAIFITAFLYITFCPAGAEVTLTPQGRLAIGSNITLEWRHNPAWQPIVIQGHPVLRNNTATLSGQCRFNGKLGADAEFSLTGIAENQWMYHATLYGIGATQHIYAEIKLPADNPTDVEVNGKVYHLTERKQQNGILTWSPVQKNNSMRIEADDGVYTISGDFSAAISDLRGATGENFYSITIYVPESSQEKRFDMNVNIRREPVQIQPIDISQAANMGFADQKPDDYTGGWTDQGPDNDMAAFNLFGQQEFAGIPFNIINPLYNHGRSCIVTASTGNLPDAAPIILQPAAKARYLYLLHAAAWPPENGRPNGTIKLTFDDQSSSEIPVISGKDCGNWWNPVFSFENALSGWTGSNRSGQIGLFVSAFQIPEKPLQKIQFIPQNGMWMIAGAALGNIRPQRNGERRMTIKANENWQPVELPVQFIKNSVMDFSRFNRISPDRDGALIITKNGHFSTKSNPNGKIRLYGTNLTQNMTVPTHQEADAMAERIAREGFNSVRIHQFENWIYDWTKPSSSDFNPEKLDNFMYLWARLREKNLYLTIDLNCTRVVRPADNIAECQSSDSDSIRKPLTMFSPSAMEDWKRFATKLMTTENPYTGLSLAEDPALFAINMDNEAPVYHTWKLHPQLMPLIEQTYAEYLHRKNIYSDQLLEKRGEEFYDFLKERQFNIQRQQVDFLKNVLKVKAYIANLNNEANLNLQPFRQELDVVDAHIYHDHPTYPLQNWNVPISNTQKSAIASGNEAMLNNMRIRIPGKPMIATELQFCYPNRFRSEIAPLAGAYAAMQDWDAIYRFAYGHSTDKISRPTPVTTFDHFYDPIGILSGRIIYFLFVRGDVAPAEGPIVCYGWNDPAYDDKFDPDFRNLGLFTRIGSAPQNAKIDNTLILPQQNWLDALPLQLRTGLKHYQDSGTAVSSTGEITLDRKENRITVITPRSELFTFTGGNAGGEFVSIEKSGGFATISAHSLDNLPLKESRDILLFHLTNALNSGTVFQNEEMRLTLDNGSLPVLVRNGRAEITLNVNPNAGKWEVQAAALDGSILKTVPAKMENGKLKFNISIFNPEGVCMIYRIVAK